MDKKLNIGIDVDDTFFNMLPKWIEHIVERTGIPAVEWYPHLDGGFKTFWKVVQDKTGYNPLEWWKRDDLYCGNGPAQLDHAAHTIRKWIADGHRVTFVTTSFNEHVRSKDLAVEFALHVPRDKFDIIHTDVKNAYEFDVFIDDAEHNVQPYYVSHPKALILMPRTPVNQSFAETRLGQQCVVDDWFEIEYRVDSLLKGQNDGK